MHRKELRSLGDFARFNPVLLSATLCFSVLTAILEGIGIGFILPIVELTREGASTDSTYLQVFVDAYEFAGVPFELEYVILGVSLVLLARYSATFAANWLKNILSRRYEREMKVRVFENALKADVSTRDRAGSDTILNSIVTESNKIGALVIGILDLFRLGVVSLAYLLIAVSISPLLAGFAVVVFGILTFLTRYLINPGAALGNRVATANEQIQKHTQRGIRGLQEVKLFGMRPEVSSNFERTADTWAEYKVKLARDGAFLSSFYNFASAATLFAIIYVALEIASLSLGALGVFLFAMLRLAPRVSNMNNQVYTIEGTLPHLTQILSLTSELEADTNRRSGSKPAPTPVTDMVAEDVSFAYDDDGTDVKDVSFAVSKGEFIAFVGKSGAGKSTIVSLLARLYDPDSGRILVNGKPLTEIDPADWRSRIAVVLQQPYMFNDTLQYNLTIGNRDASQAEIDRACEIARVDEFFDELPNGYETMIGEDGVRLSGGQKQRVAIARAILKDPDVLILDEATSDLDGVLEAEIQQHLIEMDREFAMIAVAHRLSTIIDADRIYALEDGRIIEEGPHDRLIDNNGHYADLYASN